MNAPVRIGINGFGRMGRLALRAGWDRGAFELVHANQLRRDAGTCAHLLEFDSVHGVEELARYDNDRGYASRLVELAALVGASSMRTTA